MNIPNGTIAPVTTKHGLTFREVKQKELEEILKLPDEEQVAVIFRTRLIDWPFNEECNDVNKNLLIERSHLFALIQLREANNLLHEARKEEIENLLDGANGATHPEG